MNFRALVLCLFILNLAGCGSLGALSSIAGAVGGGDGDSYSVDAELTGRDRTTTSDVQFGSRMDADTINNITDIPPYVLFLLVLGWVMPTPAKLWLGAKKRFNKN